MLVSFRRLVMVVAILPLGLIGVVLSLLVFNRPLGFVAILGILALIGMIAKNAVILIVSIEEERASGLARARRGGDLGHQPVAADDADRDVHRARPAPDRAHRVLGPDGLRHHGRSAGGHAADAGVPADAVHGGVRQREDAAPAAATPPPDPWEPPSPSTRPAPAAHRRRFGADAARPDGAAALPRAKCAQLFNSMDPAPFRERDLDPKRRGLHRRLGRARRRRARRWRWSMRLGRAPAAAGRRRDCWATRCTSTSASARRRHARASCGGCSAPAASAC